MGKYNRFVVMMLCVNALMTVSCSKQDAVPEFTEKKVSTSDTFLGNSSANHANGGMICGEEEGEGIYFVDWNENGYLYKMLPDGSGKELILENFCYNINVIGDYIYYQNGSDSSIQAYCVSSGECNILVEDLVEDMVVTSEAIYFISNKIEKMALNDGERIELMPEGEYFYLDVYGDDLFYTRMEEEIALYTVTKEGENPHLLLAGAKGAVVIEGKIFYTGVEDNMLYCYNIEEQKKVLIDEGYNANIWKDNIYYIKDDSIYCWKDDTNTVVLQDYFEQITSSYKLEAYYIVKDYMYIVYSVYGDDIGYEKMIALNLVSNNAMPE